MDQKNYKRTYKKLIQRFIVASLLLLMMLFMKQLITQYQITREKNTSHIINLAGRQRMLGQKIVKNIVLIHADGSTPRDKIYKEELESNLELWKKSHLELLELNKTNNFLKKDNNVILQMSRDLEPNLEAIIQSAEGFLSKLSKKGQTAKELDLYVEVVIANEDVFLEKMDAIVLAYDEKSAKSIQTMQITHMVLFILIIIILIFIVITMFIPLLDFTNTAFLKVSENNENLIKIVHTMKGALFVTKRDGEILFLNSDAQRIVSPNKELDKKLYLKTNIKWIAFDIQNVIDAVKKDAIRIEDVETIIEDKNGKLISVMISAVSGTYGGHDAVILSLLDITDQKKAEEALKNAAINDELTGLYNRYFLESILEGELGRAQRYEIPLSVALLDLDYFKEVNDRWGHPVGDTVLKHTADILKDNIRQSDFAVRIGGEEFLILMPNTDAKGAVGTAEKLRQAIENAVHPVVGKFTASFGVAERMADESYQYLYNRVDEALYKAKESGRNCVVLSQTLSCEYTSIPYEWNNYWNSGEAKIDHQHKVLFQVVSQLAQRAKSTDDKEAAMVHLNHIIRDIEEHFEYEEEVLIQANYIDVYDHKLIHAQLIERSKEIRRGVENGEVDAKKAYDLIFDEVIVGHLLCEDVKFYPWIQKSDV